MDSNQTQFYCMARLSQGEEVGFYVDALDFPSAFAAAEEKLARSVRGEFIVTTAQHCWTLDKKGVSNV
jgi:hypothetical protein